MNLCFDVIICTKFLHHRRLFCENNIPSAVFSVFCFLTLEELNKLRQSITLDIFNSQSWMLGIGYLINLYRLMFTTNPLKIRREIKSESEGLWLFYRH